jgi:beta-glucosidase
MDGKNSTLSFFRFVILLLCSVLAASGLQAGEPDIERRVEELLSNMTLDQKIGQMLQSELQHTTPEEVKQYHIGSVLNGGGSWPDLNRGALREDWIAKADGYWLASTNNGTFVNDDGTPAIPIIWGIDAVHGNNNVRGATLFPHNIGLGAANDPTMIKRIGQVTALEVLAIGVDWTFAPTLAVVRDDRWGRTYEGYSEDPEIVKAYAGNMVEGLQSHLNPNGVVATAKHWVGDGGTDQGKDQGNTILSEEDLRNIHMQGYFPALEAGVQTVMVSFNSWNDEKIHGNKYLITDVLKEELGFDGLVVSDWNGHGQVEGCIPSNCPQAVNAGIDMFMVPYKSDWMDFLVNLKQQVVDGVIPMSRIDDAVTRILRVKMRAELFHKPRPSERKWSKRKDVIGAPQHRELAREAVRKSLVLLKNSNGILPLDRNARILVSGKNANSIRNQNGGWTISWQGNDTTVEDFPGATSIWQGIQEAAPNASLHNDGEIAQGAYDVGIVVIGETPYAEGIGDIGKTKTLEHARLHPEDLAAIEELRDAGLPVVTIMVTGRPLHVNKELNRSAAFVVAWLPGSEGGGIADVIFAKKTKEEGEVTGDRLVNYGFTGKLSYSWPEADCQTSLNIGDDDYRPLFPYGYGLTYADTDTLGDSLIEESTGHGCGVTGGGGGSEVDQPLDIFVLNAGDIWTPWIGDPSNWGGSSALNDAGLPNVSAIKVDDQNGIQFAAKRVTFNEGAGQFYFQAIETSDLRNYLNSGGTLNFDMKVISAPTDTVTVRIDCVYPCIGEVDFTDEVNAVADNAWHEMSIPLESFAFSGTDFSQINTPFLMFTNGQLQVELANIRWEGGDGSNGGGGNNGGGGPDPSTCGTLYSSTGDVDLVPTIADWSSGSTLTEITDDPDYGQVMEVLPGMGWGGLTSAIAFTDIDNYQATCESITFKVKSDDLSAVYVKVPEVEISYNFADGIDLGNGWYEMSIPLSDFAGAIADTTEFAIHSGWSNGGTFYVTDVVLPLKP